MKNRPVSYFIGSLSSFLYFIMLKVFTAATTYFCLELNTDALD